MDGGRINEATCLVCGNEEAGMFKTEEEAGADGD
jgi:hypothetical protein